MIILSETKQPASTLRSCSLFLSFVIKSCYSSSFGGAWFKLEIFILYPLSTLPLLKLLLDLQEGCTKTICKLSPERPWIYEKTFFAHEGKIGGLAFLIEIILTTHMESTMDV